MVTELQPRELLEELLERSEPTGQRKKPVGEIRHHLFPFVHVRNYVKLGEPSVAYLAIPHRCRNDTGNAAARRQGCIGHGSHEP